MSSENKGYALLIYQYYALLLISVQQLNQYNLVYSSFINANWTHKLPQWFGIIRVASRLKQVESFSSWSWYPNLFCWISKTWYMHLLRTSEGAGGFPTSFVICFQLSLVTIVFTISCYIYHFRHPRCSTRWPVRRVWLWSSGPTLQWYTYQLMSTPSNLSPVSSPFSTTSSSLSTLGTTTLYLVSVIVVVPR